MKTNGITDAAITLKRSKNFTFDFSTHICIRKLSPNHTPDSKIPETKVKII